MLEDHAVSVDVELGEVIDVVAVSPNDVAIGRTTEQSEDDVFRRCIVIDHQQMMTSYRSSRPYNDTLHFTAAQYDKIEEFNVDSQAECGQLNLHGS